MRFAIVDGIKVEASPKTTGECTNCGAELVAKCGRVKVWHWAHKSKIECDPWWENETQWHRDWKDHFPIDWQEVSHIDSNTGEKHIADVKSPFGLVIEIQHSPIKFNERLSREQFYKDMIWIIDGNRAPLDKSHFNMWVSTKQPLQTSPVAFPVKWWGKGKLLENWSGSAVKVYLDFGEETLWRLVVFDKSSKKGAVAPISKKVLIEDCLKGNTISTMSLE
jgi:competence protein CoiA